MGKGRCPGLRRSRMAMPLAMSSALGLATTRVKGRCPGLRRSRMAMPRAMSMALTRTMTLAYYHLGLSQGRHPFLFYCFLSLVLLWLFDKGVCVMACRYGGCSTCDM